ncbi:MAG: nucleoside kinase [Clostridia bacterium]|nr:nucleoside kinase [Clostridia bacterium]
MADRSLEAINRMAREDPRALIREADDAYRAFIDGTCARILDGGRVRVLLLAGPSGSGKTTSANMIADAVRRAGHKSHVISLDNFYREANDPLYPRKADGERDLESYEALDLARVRDCLARAARGEAFSVPYYDFKTGRYRADTYDVAASDDGVIIVEGLHALNPDVTAGLPSDRVLKLFVSVSTNLTVGGKRVLSGRKLRFLRRLVRDHLYRGASATRTLSLWDGVLAGEDTYLYPYRGEADITADTFHAYELGLLAPFASEVLRADPSDDPYAAVVANAVELAHPISEALVPQDSLMREFIIGGTYEHLY